MLWSTPVTFVKISRRHSLLCSVLKISGQNLPPSSHNPSFTFLFTLLLFHFELNFDSGPSRMPTTVLSIPFQLLSSSDGTTEPRPHVPSLLVSHKSSEGIFPTKNGCTSLLLIENSLPTFFSYKINNSKD